MQAFFLNRRRLVVLDFYFLLKMKIPPLIIVKGRTTDDQTRCIHYHSAVDIIAIKFKCCNTYYPCFYCHEEEAGHYHLYFDNLSK